jgi:hypothetical protein
MAQVHNISCHLMKAKIDEWIHEFLNTTNNIKNYSMKDRTWNLEFKHFFAAENTLVIK